MVNHSFQIGVIGAGAAGMMAAAEAARSGASVVLVEKNRKPGVKILMSGGTRCNITHHTNAKGISRAFGAGGRFLQPSLGAFPPEKVVRMFEDLGVATKVEETGKVFPVSDRALHVRDALLNQALELGVKVHTEQPVLGFQSKGQGGWEILTSTDHYDVQRLIVTAGGKSWPGCGTTGDAYPWLTELGHQIVAPRPALVPLVGGSSWMHDMAGLTLTDCEVSVVVKLNRSRKPLARRRGSLLITHRGFSGPAAMDISGALTAMDSPEDVEVLLDSLPSVDENQLIDHLTDRSREGGRQRIATLLAHLLPKRLAIMMAQQFNADCTVAELPKTTRLRLLDAVKRLPLSITGTLGFDKAEVTAGGVQLDEIHPKTMESRICPGLYIAGEVLNVDGPIGGYNFQAAFSTGRAAGIAAAKSLE